MSSLAAKPIVKEVKPINFLYLRTMTRVQELGRFVGVVARELYRDAVFNDIEITGPVYWNYINFNGDEESSFLLEIALPISEIPGNYEGKFQVKRSDTFHCLSIYHTGTWYDIPQCYKHIGQWMAAHELKGIGQNREIFINVDFINPVANITEIQVGITPSSFELLAELPVESQFMEIQTFSE